MMINGKNETLVQKSKAEDKCLKSNVRKPRSKVLHLAFPARLGKEDRHTKGLIRYDEEVIFHPFVRLGETRDEFNSIGLGFKVKPCPCFLLAFV